jgi:hypothetical protein
MMMVMTSVDLGLLNRVAVNLHLTIFRGRIKNGEISHKHNKNFSKEQYHIIINL